MDVEGMLEKIASGEIKWIYCEESKKYYRVTAEEITEKQYEAEYMIWSHDKSFVTN